MYSPVADTPQVADKMLAEPIGDLSDKRLGLLWNARKSAKVYLEVVEERMKEKYPGLETTYYHVDTLIDLTRDDVLDDISRWAETETDACVTAMAECGSCTKFLTYGTNAIEETGTPAVGLVKSGFQYDWITNSKDHGRPLRFYLIDEGENLIDKDRIRDHMTREAIDDIEHQITSETARDVSLAEFASVK